VINARIARRYAKALLSIGREDGQAETYKKDLEGFATLFDKNPQLEMAITNPLYNAESRGKVLAAVIERVGPSPMMVSFLSLLFDKNRIQHLRDIYTFYEKLTDEMANIVRANVVSAVELPEKTIGKIKKALSDKTGKEVALEATVDPSLIGGVVTKIGDLVLDGSVRTQLISLKETLQRGEGI
jgi:F-type H+-transporting ATPase subunit delta